MSSYCLKYRKNTENVNPKVSKTSNGKTMILSKCAICGSKKTRFIKKQEAKGLLSKLGDKTTLNKVPLLGNIFFKKCTTLKKDERMMYKKCYLIV